MASSQSSPSKSVSKDPSQLDPDTQIDTDCIVRWHLNITALARLARKGRLCREVQGIAEPLNCYLYYIGLPTPNSSLSYKKIAEAN